MELLVIRHADAGDAADFARSGRPDDERPLSAEGRKKMSQGARGLREIAPDVAVLATSPLTRARQTADIVAEAYGGLPIETVPALRPAQPPAALAEWLARRAAEGLVAVVGHEPHLSTTVGWLLTGEARSLVELKKGAACLLATDRAWGPGAAVLRWSLMPGQLRALGD
jgi:phosphohistidine phosphatase